MIDSVGKPEFFPKVERADQQRSKSKSKSKEADASELLSSSSKSSSSDVRSSAKQSSAPKAPKSFDQALKDARSDRPEARTDRPAEPKKLEKYNSQGEVDDGSQPDNNDTLQDKVARRALDSKSKDEMQTKADRNKDFVMPNMLPAKFSVPKHGLETEGSDNEMIPQMADEDEMMKQEAVSDFVEQMKDKFGISAEQILAAFAQLNPQVMAAPVSESTQAFVNELPLQAEQKSEAAALYTKMLEKSGDKVFSEQMMGNPQASVGTEVLGQKEYDQRGLDQSLRQMNQSFFQNAKVEDKNQNGKVSVAGMTAATGTLAAQTSQATAESATSAAISSSGASTNHLSSAGKKSADEASAASVGIVSGITSAFSGENKSASSTGGGSDWSSQQHQQQQQPQANAQGKMQAPIVAAGAFTPEMAKGKSASAMGADGKQIKGLKGDDLLNALNSSLGQGLTANKLAEGSATGAMLPNAVQPNAEEKTANIQNLIKQAQVIIKQGGGEMKLQMSPEGMGQVNLKVAVENGQVNIQMITHNKEAKRMIEEGLSELKASLAAHKLQVDNLKVDLSEGISKQMQDQLNDHQQNRAREMAQNFLANNRDERQGFREGFFNNSSGYKSYKDSSEREGGVPQPNSVAAASAKRKQTDRRLDMVA